jgi:hypothetical protein
VSVNYVPLGRCPISRLVSEVSEVGGFLSCLPSRVTLVERLEVGDGGSDVPNGGDRKSLTSLTTLTAKTMRRISEHSDRHLTRASTHKRLMSAFGGKADIARVVVNIRF